MMASRILFIVFILFEFLCAASSRFIQNGVLLQNKDGVYDSSVAQSDVWLRIGAEVDTDSYEAVKNLVRVKRSIANHGRCPRGKVHCFGICLTPDECDD